MGLLLQTVDAAGTPRWRWLLTDEKTGTSLADQPVDLEPGSDEVAAFADLFSYAYRHAVPDCRAADMARIVAGAGEWAGRVLLGEKVGTAILETAPVTVRVMAEATPGDPLPVLARPLELAYAGGRPGTAGA